MKYLVRSAALIGFPELVELYGRRPVELLDAAGIPPAALKNPELYLPYPALARLMTLAAQRCDASDFGARLGSRQGLEVVGALGTLLCLQTQVGDALTLIHRHVGFHARGVSIDVLRAAGTVSLEMRLAFGSRVDSEQLLALSMALLVRSIAQLHSTSLRPIQVDLAMARPDDLRGWRNAYGCMPTFDADVSVARYPAALLSLPVHITEHLRDRLNAQWRGSDRRENTIFAIAPQVERAIVALLPTGDCSLESVAQLVELSPRVLQLQLKRETTTFGELLRNVRERLARDHLEHSDMEVTSLAMHLGFGGLPVFSRAFKTWTGKSPREWRHSQAG